MHPATPERLRGALTLPGVLGLALVNWRTGTVLCAFGREPSSGVETAALGNVAVFRDKQSVIDSLHLGDQVEEILITLQRQYHLIRPVQSNPDVFLYGMLARAQTTLVMARFHLLELERELKL